MNHIFVQTNFLFAILFYSKLVPPNRPSNWHMRKLTFAIKEFTYICKCDLWTCNFSAFWITSVSRLILCTVKVHKTCFHVRFVRVLCPQLLYLIRKLDIMRRCWYEMCGEHNSLSLTLYILSIGFSAFGRKWCIQNRTWNIARVFKNWDRYVLAKGMLSNPKKKFFLKHIWKSTRCWNFAILLH